MTALTLMFSYFYLQPMSCSAWNSTFSLECLCTIISQAPKKDFPMEIFSPNPSKKRKSLEQDVSLFLVLLLGCTRGHPRPVPSALHSSPSPCFLSSSSIQRFRDFPHFQGEPEAQQAAEGEGRADVFPGSEHCCSSAQTHTVIQHCSRLCQTLRMNPKIPDWVGLERILQLLSFATDRDIFHYPRNPCAA